MTERSTIEEYSERYIKPVMIQLADEIEEGIEKFIYHPPRPPLLWYLKSWCRHSLLLGSVDYRITFLGTPLLGIQAERECVDEPEVAE